MGIRNSAIKNAHLGWEIQPSKMPGERPLRTWPPMALDCSPRRRREVGGGGPQSAEPRRRRPPRAHNRGNLIPSSARGLLIYLDENWGVRLFPAGGMGGYHPTDPLVRLWPRKVTTQICGLWCCVGVQWWCPDNHPVHPVFSRAPRTCQHQPTKQKLHPPIFIHRYLLFTRTTPTLAVWVI